MAVLDPDAFDVLTFDCYGTLIDWETGIARALRAALGAAAGARSDEDLLAAFADVEHAAEVPYKAYRDVLALSLDGVAAHVGATVDAQARAAFADSVGDWPAFADSHDALVRLQARYRLMPITNCDDDLFARSAERLGITFDDVVTAEQAGAYKPDEAPFRLAFARAGVPPERILHVAQSLFHDHVTAQRLGLTSVWIDRRGARTGSGATPPAAATADLRLPDLRALADLLTG